MNTAAVVSLADYRKSAAPADRVETESAPVTDPDPDARRAPEPASAPAFTYPPARPIVEWMPARDPVEARVDEGFRWLAFLALAGAGAILAGAVLTTVAGAFAAVAVGGV